MADVRPPLDKIETTIELNELYRHKKTSGYYRPLAVARIEETLAHVVVYKHVSTENIWVRPLAEFEEKFVLAMRRTDR